MNILTFQICLIGVLIGVIPCLTQSVSSSEGSAAHLVSEDSSSSSSSDASDNSVLLDAAEKRYRLGKRYRLHGKRADSQELSADVDDADSLIDGGFVDKRYRLGKKSFADPTQQLEQLEKRYRLGKRYRLAGKRSREFNLYKDEDTSDASLVDKRYRLAGKRYRLGRK